MTTPNLGVTMEAAIVENSPLTDHIPVKMVIPTFGDIHLGQSIRKTTKLIPTPEQRDEHYKLCFNMDQNINDLWHQRTTQAEEWLSHCLNIFPTRKERGRGQGIHKSGQHTGGQTVPR